MSTSFAAHGSVADLNTRRRTKLQPVPGLTSISVARSDAMGVLTVSSQWQGLCIQQSLRFNRPTSLQRRTLHLLMLSLSCLAPPHTL